MDAKDIHPWNRMPPPDPNDLGKPVVEMSETKQLLYMCTGDAKFLGTDVNFMASITYDSKDKTIELRGRMRYESTGRKTVFSGPAVEYSAKSYKDMRAKVNQLLVSMPKSLPGFTPNNNLMELEFAIGTDMDTIIKELNDSNRFNIGIAELPKK